MQITLMNNYRLEVSPDELNLIGLALCGRLKPTQRQAAYDLNKRLLQQRRAAHADHVDMVDRALAKLQAEEPDNDATKD